MASLLNTWFHEEEQDLRLEDRIDAGPQMSRPKNLSSQRLVRSSHRLPEGKATWSDYNGAAGLWVIMAPTTATSIDKSPVSLVSRSLCGVPPSAGLVQWEEPRQPGLALWEEPRQPKAFLLLIPLLLSYG